MAANFTKIGLNFSGINNLSAPEFGFQNLTKEEFINHIPQNANTVTNDLYGIIVLTVLLVFLIWMLTDISRFGLFRYSTIRDLGIATGITVTMGINMISVGYATNFIHLSILTAVYILCLVYTIIANPT